MARGERRESAVVLGKAPLVLLVSAEQLELAHTVVARRLQGPAHEHEADRGPIPRGVAPRLVVPLGSAVAEAVPGGDRSTIDFESPQAQPAAFQSRPSPVGVKALASGPKGGRATTRPTCRMEAEEGVQVAP